MKIERVQPGQGWPRASSWNAIADAVDGLNNISGAELYNLVSQSAFPHWGIFELTENFQSPDQQRTGGSQSEPDVFWVDNCRWLVYYHGEYEYRIDDSPTFKVTLYAPLSHRNAYGIARGVPPHGTGDRCYATWNKQSSRWEIISPPFGIWRFRLDDNLVVSGSATANYVRSNGTVDTNFSFTVYDALGIFSGTADVSKGYCVYMPDNQHWEILQMTCI